MHRFYAFHSFTMFHRNSIAAASFFLAAKVCPKEMKRRKMIHLSIGYIYLYICVEKKNIDIDSV